MRKQHQPKKAGHLQQFSATYPFQVVGVDIFGPLPPTLLGNRYVVVIVDRFSRWVELTAVPDILAETIADVVVNELIFRHGCPTQLLTDRGSPFTARLFKRICQRLQVDKVFTTAYHPQTNGRVERFNSSLAAGLTACTDEDQTDWDQYLKALAFAYRTSLVDAIHNSPFFLVHGRDARLPSDVLWGPEQEITNDENDYGIVLTSKLRRAFELARATQIETDVRRKKYYDSRAKLRRHFDGPYLVRRPISRSMPPLRRYVRACSYGHSEIDHGSCSTDCSLLSSRRFSSSFFYSSTFVRHRQFD